MAALNKSEARKIIAKLKLDSYANRAVAFKQLARKDVDTAISEYRHFMLLVWINVTMSNKEMVVPTVLADAIWHEHLLDSANYRLFCHDLIGRYIDHFPGLEKGTTRHHRAVEHTRDLSREYASSDGFVPMYLAMCGGFSHSTQTPHHVDGNNHSSSHTDHGQSDGGHSSHHSSDSSSSTSSSDWGSSSSDSSSSGSSSCSSGGASCGGGGCGGS